MSGRKKPRRARWVPIYSAIVVSLSSTSSPMPLAFREQMLWELRAAVQAMAGEGDGPTLEHWRVCCDAVNVLETIVTKGWATDPDGLQREALNGLAEAGRAAEAGAPLALTAAAAEAMRYLIDDYEQCLAGLAEKSMRIALNETDRRTYALRHGINRDHNDSHVVIAL